MRWLNALSVTASFKAILRRVVLFFPALTLASGETILHYVSFA
ncbi:hypothetical protein MKY54_20170 [Paenibacillus sp. FSL P2-0121]